MQRRYFNCADEEDNVTASSRSLLAAIKLALCLPRATRSAASMRAIRWRRFDGTVNPIGKTRSRDGRPPGRRRASEFYGSRAVDGCIPARFRRDRDAIARMEQKIDRARTRDVRREKWRTNDKECKSLARVRQAPLINGEG